MKIVVSSLLIVIGLLILAFSFVASLDPEGAKMSDDGDPFGEPPSRLESAVVGGVGVALVAAGLWLGFFWYRHRYVA